MVEKLSVRVGVGWSPLDRAAVGSPTFFRTIDLLEELDYDSIWLSDTATGPGPAPLLVLAAVAARTQRLKLGTSVLVVPPRTPVLLAKEFATLDTLSDGRFFPAVGVGINTPAELSALGIAQEERMARMEEAIAIIEQLWRGEPVTFDGRFSTLEDVTLTPKPTRSSLEIWLSGSSPAALRRIGRIGHGWLASRVSADEFARGIDAIRAAAADAGRRVPEDHYGVIVYAARTQKVADRLVAGMRARIRPGLEPADFVGVGVDGAREILARFRAAGATKFVLGVLESDPMPFLRELKTGAVDPIESAG